MNGREIFAYAALDDDGAGSHLRVLRKFAREGLLSAGFSVWSPDFEEANFSLEELALAATNLAAQIDQEITFTSDDIQQRMKERGIPAGTAIEQIASAKGVFLRKGEGWGSALAALATTEHLEVPEKIQDEHGNRPILTDIQMLLRGASADFPLSLEHTKTKYAEGI